MPCQSTIPPLPDKSAGWTCTGEDLVMLMTTRMEGREVPVVCPREYLHVAMGDPWARYTYRPRAYLASGDHLHLRLNDLPPTLTRWGRVAAWWADFVPWWRR
jgi:hypothetical protein